MRRAVCSSLVVVAVLCSSGAGVVQAATSLDPVEHQIEIAGGTLHFQQIQNERLTRTVFRFLFSGTLTPASAELRMVSLESAAPSVSVVHELLEFHPEEGESLFAIEVDRTTLFHPDQLSFALVLAMPALSASQPADLASDVATSAWLVLDFDAAHDPASLATFSLFCDGLEPPIEVESLGPQRVVVNPSGSLPPETPCTLSWLGPSGLASLEFETAAEQGGSVFYDLRNKEVFVPFPDDSHLVVDGTKGTGYRVDLPLPDRAPDMIKLSEALIAPTRTLDGFSPLGAVVVLLSEAPDPESLPMDAAASLDPLASIGIFDMDPASPTFGDRVPFDLSVKADAVPSAPQAIVHQLVMYPTRPFSPQGRYGFVFTRRARTASGKPFGPSEFSQLVLDDPEVDEVAEVSDARAAVRDVLDRLESDATPAIRRDDIALALSITIRSTDDIPNDALAMKAQVLARPRPELTIASCSASFGLAAVVHGTWNAPDWRAGPHLARDAQGVPQIQGTRPVPFVLAIPDASLSEPAPIVMYQHGNPGDSSEVISEGQSKLAPAGFATIGFTDPANNDFPTPALQRAYLFGQIVLAGKPIPDLYIEAYGEQMAFLRLIEGLGELDVVPLDGGGCGGDGSPDLAPTEPLNYVGISYGAVHGAALMPYAPEIAAAALVAGGGGWTERLFLQETTDPLLSGSIFFTLLPVFVPTLRPEDVWAGLQLLQMSVDPQEPNNHAAFTYSNRIEINGTTRKPSILIVQGVNDSFSPDNAIHAEAWASGPIPHLSPHAVPIPTLEQVDERVVGNIDAETTAALVQFVPQGIPGVDPTPGCGGEGHYCAQVAASAIAQRVAFFLSALTSSPPSIIDATLDSDEDFVVDVIEIVSGTDPEDGADF